MAGKIAERCFGATNFKFNRWSAELEEGQTLDDVMHPAFWANVVNQIMGHAQTGGRGDIIEVRKIETGLYAEFMVTEIGPGFVKLIPLRAVEPPAVEIAENAPLTVKWNVGKRCHDVIRRGDNAVMQSGFQSKAGAAAWIEDHLKKMAA